MILSVKDCVDRPLITFGCSLGKGLNDCAVDPNNF